MGTDRDRSMTTSELRPPGLRPFPGVALGAAMLRRWASDLLPERVPLFISLCLWLEMG